jgi:subtilisin family serine protease
MLQTGVLATHSEFDGRVQAGINFSFDDDVSDGNGHGTHVAVRETSRHVFEGAVLRFGAFSLTHTRAIWSIRSFTSFTRHSICRQRRLERPMV